MTAVVRYDLQIATLRGIYRNTGRREFALLFIKSSQPSERAMLLAELEHLELMRGSHIREPAKEYLKYE